ncbi:MAG: winged helix-turn-helix domain-containing protein [Proteobacteria bacterium]|nr:winged helix-turn-helix domain-containing protein [Pseudomonadota bacterium]MBU1638972.1 winged helix-turn-helix domain-containing protein [Pseudomonadota bacterium]
MTSVKKNKLTETTEKVGKALARSTFKAESAGKLAQKKVEDLVGKVSKRAHEAMDAVTKLKGSEKKDQEKHVSPPFKANKGLTIPDQFGFIAGNIHDYLDKNGMVPTNRLINAIMQKKNSKANVLAAIGWLARENKLQFSKDGEMISLK